MDKAVDMETPLGKHLESCPICSTLDEDGNERICRVARELARLVVQMGRQIP